MTSRGASSAARAPIPLRRRRGGIGTRVGVGLRTPHHRHLLAEHPALDVIEVISDNLLADHGRPLEVLDALSDRYPMVMHGVGLSIGSTDPLDRGYVRDLIRLRDRCRAGVVSDHLCFTGVAGRTTHDLLPLPYTTATLEHVADRVRAVQDLLGTPLALENPSTYLAWTASTIPEHEFLAELCRRTGCTLLVDVNNLHVNAVNHGIDPRAWLDGIPWDRVRQFHIAGHTRRGRLLIDTHDSPVVPEVHDLLRLAHRRAPDAPIVLEWDAAIPDFPTVHAEALRAREILA